VNFLLVKIIKTSYILIECNYLEGYYMKLLTEMGPLLIFFIVYKFSDIMFATAAMLISTVIVVVMCYLLTQKVSTPLLISSFIVVIFGTITILVGDPSFIKMKPTIVNFVFATALLVGVTQKKGYIQYLFQGTIEMSQANWLKLSKRFMIFFVAMAITNEVIWRNYSEDTWVNFKVFGMLPLTFAFILTQLPFIYKQQHNNNANVTH